MSNADDICRRADCRMPRNSAAHGYGPGAHDFVEPAPGAVAWTDADEVGAVTAYETKR